MNHTFDGVSSTDREKLFATHKKCCSLNKSSSHLKGSCRDGQHRMKHLKSRRERSQVRGGGKVHRHHHQTSEGPVHVHNCCQSGCRCPSKRNTPFANVLPAPQEPSIITGNRLIGHQGLFNREVKSIDIERLLSGGKQEREKNGTSQPSVTSPTPSSNPKTDLPDDNTGNVSPFVTKALEKEGESPGSDLTPGQKPPQPLHISSGSLRSCRSSFADEMIIQNSKTNDDKSESVKEARLSPCVDPDNVRTVKKNRRAPVVSRLEHNPTTREESHVRTQAHSLSPSPAQLCSSRSPDASTRTHPDRVLERVGTVAARLLDRVQLPPLSRRKLVDESRQVLLSALQDRYGARLKDLVSEMQRRLSFCSDTTMEVQNQQPTEPLAADASAAASQANAVRQPHFHTLQTTTFNLTRSRRLAQKSSPPPQRTSKWPAEQFIGLVETPVRRVDDIFRPARSPQLSTDFEWSGDAARDLFSSSPDAGWGVRVSASQRQEDVFNRPELKEAVTFGSYEDSLFNLTREAPKRWRGSQCSDGRLHPLLPSGAQPPHRLPAGLFHSEGCTFSPSSSSSSSAAQIKHPQQSSSLQPTSAWPPLRPSHTDMTHYPPAHVLERDPLLPSLPSLKDWTFHPMRLY